eukprot:15010198-Alexandrium_andersonii.AAC.1
MSASLVGSEMCIRDSLPSHCSPRAWYLRIGAPRPLVASSGPQEDAQVPVSYTHLTLPTICSV